MYVQLGRKLEAPVMVTSDRHGEPILVLRYGERVNHALVKVMDHALSSFTTYDAALAQVLETPLTCRQTAAALGGSTRWLADLAREIPTVVSHSRVTNHTLFYPDDVWDLRERCRRGELVYAGKHGEPRRVRLVGSKAASIIRVAKNG